MARTPTPSSSKPAARSAPSARPSKAASKPSASSPTSSAAATPGSSRTSEPRARKRIDWEAIERDYRTGKFTLRELESKHGAENSTIARRAAKGGWSKDLATAVRQATNAKLIAAAVQQECSTAQQNAATTVLAAAELNKQVILQHRTELQAARQLAMDLLAEVKQAALLDEHQELLAQILAGSGANPVDEAQCRQAVQKALATGSRVSSVKALAETLTKLHSGERVAFGLNDDQPPADTRTSLPIEFVDASPTDG